MLTRVDLISPVVRRWIEDGRRDPDAFWERAARELPWFRPWDRIFDWQPPTFRWFVGAQTNLACNAVDRHVALGWGTIGNISGGDGERKSRHGPLRALP